MAKREIKTDAWLATYADTVTLLLTFFVLLYSFSTVDAEKFRQISNSFQSMFSGDAASQILDFNIANGEVPVVGEPQPSAEASKPETMYDEIVNFIKENNLEDDVQVYENYKGVNIELKEAVLFDTGKAILHSDSLGLLNKVNDVVSKVSSRIIIEGHSDNVPIKTAQFPSNWYLSSARAISVLDYFLITKGQINPERFSVQAFGEYSPIVSNDTPENRAKNRRVNIIIVSSKTEQ
ncbi:flagellar motor protein MotB [Clostridium sp.]|uniref:flagellar motor protein MotB n=1 Tax=Clostridium sp. TaxID=1506 RepID=UPI002FC63782